MMDMPEARTPMFDRRTMIAALALLPIGPGRAAGAALRDATIAAIERAHGGRLGVFALDTGSGRTLAHRADERFLMCSSFKVVLAACVLARVDAGLDRLDDAVRYGAADLLPFSPVTQAQVAIGSLTLEALCDAILTDSDNAAANLLLARIGGPRALTAFARRLGDATTRFDRTEPTLNRASGLRDTTTPATIVATLRTLYMGGVLTPRSRSILERGMIANRRGPMRLRAALPADWVTGDRTGTSDDFCNDVAFARRPGKPPIAMAAYYQAHGRTMAAQEAVLQAVGAVIARWAA